MGRYMLMTLDGPEEAKEDARQQLREDAERMCRRFGIPEERIEMIECVGNPPQLPDRAYIIKWRAGLTKAEYEAAKDALREASQEEHNDHAEE